MAASEIKFRSGRGSGIVCEIHSPAGLSLVLCGDLADFEPVADGDAELVANRALVGHLWSYAKHEKLRRRLRSEEKRQSHSKQADAHEKLAKGIASLVDHITDDRRAGWCSACFENTDHRRLHLKSGSLPGYLCTACGLPTLGCAGPRCAHMATRGFGSVHVPRYCAEHRHEIPGFEKLSLKVDDLSEYEDLLAFERPNLAKNTKVGLVSVLSAGALAVTAGAAAPAIGGAIGSLQIAGGYTGAAAMSHGLAVLGGGSLAAGGFGMAGGVAVITTAGGVLGTALGARVTSAYIGDDKSFRIEKLQDGTGIPVIVANGFLTQGKDTWAGWESMIKARYPDSPVFRVHWGAKELKALGSLVSGGIGKHGAVFAVKNAAARGSRAAAKKFGPVGPILLAADFAKNPWHTAKNRSYTTGVALAGLLTRTTVDAYVLVGHSLGARVMVTAAEILGAQTGAPTVQDIHLLGAALGAKGDRRLLNDAVTSSVFNYHSSNDKVLKYFYRVAQAGSAPAGLQGFNSKFLRIKDRDVSRKVHGHSDYFEAVQLV